MIKLSQVIENKWIRECLLFTLLFILTVINDRQGVIAPHELRNGFFIFLILYIHVQFQRFLLLPFLIAKRYTAFSVLALLTVFSFAWLAFFLDMEMVNVGWYDDDLGNHMQLFLYYLFCFALSLPILLLVFFIIGYYKQQKTDVENKMLLKDLELNLLRSQLNPHFLFNSLNNLYGVSLEKPAEVSEKIMQMAQIMRYQLELSKKKYVNLSEDINFISDYIAIESDRVSECCEVQFTQETGGLQAYRIAPLILICFIENAFKHYESGLKKGFIKIELKLQENILLLYISNSSCAKKINPDSTKVGLKNTRKRLEILYPQKYELNFTDQDGKYELKFKLELDRADDQA